MKRYWPVFVLVFLLAGWWVLSRRDSGALVHFSPAATATIESTVATNGKVEPAQWAAARALTAGVVSSVEVKRGQTVAAGQTLVTLDTRLAQAELDGALARKQEAQAEANTVSQGGKAATVASLNDSLSAARVAVEVAQRNYDALARLLPQQAATRQQVDQARDTLERAKLQVISVENQQRVIVTSSDKAASVARVNDADAAVSLAQHRLDYGVVRAPISGTVYDFDLKQGAYLDPGAEVARVGNLNEAKVIVYVDEPDLGRVELGMPVVITWDGRPGKSWNGRVDQMPTEVKAMNTRTVGEVTTLVDNPDHDLLPGITVYATIVSRVVKDAVCVPKAAIRSAHNETGVYKLDNGKLQWVSVKTGASDINNVQILDGLSLGQKVADRVVEPVDAELKDGMRVRATGER